MPDALATANDLASNWTTSAGFSDIELRDTEAGTTLVVARKPATAGT
jgi:hypothetical protein